MTSNVTVENYVPHHIYAEKASGVLDVGGGASNDFGPPKPGYVWFIERITIRNRTGVLQAAVDFFEVPQSTREGSENDEDIIDFTFQGLGDVADEYSEPIIHPGNVIRAVWTGGTPTTGYSVRLQIRECVVQHLEVPVNARTSVVAQGVGA